jgi:hypothetical protein
VRKRHTRKSNLRKISLSFRSSKTIRSINELSSGGNTGTIRES